MSNIVISIREMLRIVLSWLNIADENSFLLSENTAMQAMTNCKQEELLSSIRHLSDLLCDVSNHGSVLSKYSVYILAEYVKVVSSIPGMMLTQLPQSHLCPSYLERSHHVNYAGPFSGLKQTRVSMKPGHFLYESIRQALRPGIMAVYGICSEAEVCGISCVKSSLN